MATLPLSVYIDKSVTHIKISRVDEQGNDNTLSLQELDSIRIITQDSDFPEYLDFAITSISEFPTYYLYEISPSTQPLAAYGTDTILNSVDSNIPDCTFYAERTTPFTVSTAGDAVTGYNIIYTSTPNTFNSSTGIYTVGITPNVYTSVTASVTIQTSVGDAFRLKIINPVTQEVILFTEEISAPSSPITYTTSSVFPISGSITQNLLETTQYQVIIYGDGSSSPATVSNFSWAITQSVAAKSSPAYNSVILEPYLYDVFEYSDCNVLINNATEPQYDSDFFKINYDTGQSIPTNQTQILEGTAERAPVNPSNYTSRAQIYPRYNGTKTTAPNFNASSSDGTGYGGLVVAGNPAPFVGYYTSKGGSTPEVLKKTIINLDYIVDENITAQTPALSDFTIDSQKSLFPRDGYLYLDPDKDSTSATQTARFVGSFAGNNVYKIYRSGEYATPILYSQTGSSTGFLNSLSFYPPGIETTPQFLSAKYVKNSTTLANTKSAIYWRSAVSTINNSPPYYGYNEYTNEFITSSPDFISDNGLNPTTYYRSIAETFAALPSIFNSEYGYGLDIHPHTWNQIPFYNNESIYNIDNNLNLYNQQEETGFGTPSRGSFYFPDPSINPSISCKARFTIKIKWTPQSANVQQTITPIQLIPQATTTFPLNSLNYGINPANADEIMVNPTNIPLKVGFRIRGIDQGNWNFTPITPDQYWTLSPGEEKTITIETNILPRDIGYVFVQGIAYWSNDLNFGLDKMWNMYDTNGVNLVSTFDANSTIKNYNIATNNRRSWYNQSLQILSSELEFIQVPEANEVEINYTLSTPYITQVIDTPYPNSSIGEGNYALSRIVFTSSFAQALGLIYPQVPNSGYDPTIYPFEFPANYELEYPDLISPDGSLDGGLVAAIINLFLTLSSQPYLWSYTDTSLAFSYYPPPPGTFDYEIRFNADEEQVYPIVGYLFDPDSSLFILYILRPRTSTLTSDTATDSSGDPFDPPGPVPIENYQSFLIRRWIPRAGYIYLDVDASLGKGIVKPEFITDGIQAKIPQIVKELTDKGLIT